MIRNGARCSHILRLTIFLGVVVAWCGCGACWWSSRSSHRCVRKVLLKVRSRLSVASRRLGLVIWQFAGTYGYSYLLYAGVAEPRNLTPSAVCSYFSSIKSASSITHHPLCCVLLSPATHHELESRYELEQVPALSMIMLRSGACWSSRAEEVDLILSIFEPRLEWCMKRFRHCQRHYEQSKQRAHQSFSP